MELQEVIRNFVARTGFYSKILFDEDIASRTTFKIGGKALCYVEPEDSFQLVDILSLARKYSIPYFILGGGSNVVFRDGFFKGIVISTNALSEISILEGRDTDEYVYVCAESGSSMKNLVEFCTAHSLWGLEKFAGLPGTVGGAVYMNARCFDISISERFECAYAVNLNDFEGREVYFKDSDWAYKVSPFQNGNSLIMRAVFKLKKGEEGDSEKLRLENEKYINERKARGHFDYPSAGSVFKNNRDFGFPSGKIIDDCGLRGKQIGGAQIAPFHGNFIINLGGATQKDVKNLVEYVVNTVEAKKGFKLEPEIIFF